MSDLNLDRTVKALATFDEHEAKWDGLLASDASNSQLLAHLNQEDRLAEAVGHAFGLDTSDRNAMDTCEGCVRPGPWLRGLLAGEE